MKNALKKFAFVAVLVALPIGGCGSIAQIASNIAVGMSSSSQTQVTTLAEAEQAATLITQSADVYVKTGTASRATLLQIQSLSNAVHAALTDLESARANGKSLNFASFNAALDAYDAYATNNNISH